MSPVQPQQLLHGGRDFFGKCTQLCQCLQCRILLCSQKKYMEKASPAPGMTCGRLMASPEQSWRWNLGIAEPQLHPSSSPALSQNMDKALREFREAKVSSSSWSLQCSLNPAALQHTQMECAGRSGAHRKTCKIKPQTIGGYQYLSKPKK